MSRPSFSMQIVTVAPGGTTSDPIDGRDWDAFTILSGAGTGTILHISEPTGPY